MLLEKRRPGSEKPFYRDRFAAYFDAVSNGGDPVVKSFESIVGPIAAISDEWRAYVRDLPLAPLEEGRWHLSQGGHRAGPPPPRGPPARRAEGREGGLLAGPRRLS